MTKAHMNTSIAKAILITLLTLGPIAGPQANSSAEKRDVVTVDAKPEPVAIIPKNTAVIVVDMENDFATKGGMFDRAGVDISGAQKVIAPTVKVLAAARAMGMKIIYLRMAYRPDLSDLGAPDSVNRTRHLKFGVGETIRAPDGRDSRILIRDTWDTDIVNELKPQSGDITIYKTRFSGFYQTDLDTTLKKLGLKYLIMTGVTTSICVDSTVRDAMFRDYLCVLLKDCMSEPIGSDLPRTNHEASLLTAEVLLGWVSDSDRFLKAAQGQPTDSASGKQ